MFKFSHIISSSSMQLRALVMQIFQKRSPFLYLTGWQFSVRAKVFCSFIFSCFSSYYLERIQPISLISLQLKVFRNLGAQLFHPSPRGSTDHSWPNLTSNPPQHRTISHGITDSPIREIILHQLSSSIFQQSELSLAGWTHSLIGSAKVS